MLDEKRFDELCEEITRCNNIIKAMQSQVDLDKAALKEMLNGEGVDRWFTVKHNVSLSLVTRTTIDSNVLKVKFPEAYTACARVSSYDRMNVK
jgi:hypothetical protein